MEPSRKDFAESDLHGNVPDKSEVALLLIDVINDLEFEGGEDLLGFALPMAQRIAELKTKLKSFGVPVVYANDNFGKWRSDFNQIVSHCLNDDVRGKPIARLLAPESDDYFVLKPKHSGFFSTTLDLLLRYLGVHSLILTGIAGNNCVLSTANDAYMRDFKIFVPADCVASINADDNEYALRQMRDVLKAEIGPSAQIDLNEIMEAGHGENRQQQSPATESGNTSKAARAADGF